MTLDLILIGVAITLDPLPLTAYILLVASRNGTRKGIGFTLGWLACLGVIIAATLLLTGGKPPRPNTAPSTFGLIVQVVAGVALLGLAWRQHLHTGRPKAEPGWQKNIDKVNVPAAAGIAVLLQPWVMAAAGAASVSQADLSKASGVTAIILYVVIATSSYLVMQAYVMARPEAAMRRLHGLNSWIDAHRDPAVIILFSLLGVWLIGRGTSGLF
jgi:hypothetical protein